jgi:hypothetical protein
MMTLGLSPEQQMEHGLALIDDYEQSAADGEPNERHLAAGMRSCFIALWRQAGEA